MEGCHGLNYISPKIHILKPYLLRTQNMSVLGDRVLKKVIKCTRSQDGP